MDFKLKGKSWASNIYHQFESICQDVDDFMNQDTVKFVENQVHSVKKFYSNVVPDILPPSGDTVTSKAQSVDCEQDGTQNHDTSVTDITMEPTEHDHGKLSINSGSVDTMRNSCTSLPTEHDHADPSHEAKVHLHLSEDNDGIILNDSDSSFEENDTKDTMAVTARSSSRNDIFCEMSGENHMNFVRTVDPLPVPSACEAGTSDEDHRNLTPSMDSSPAVSIHQAEALAITILHNSISEDTEQTPVVSTGDSALKNKLPIGNNPNPDVEKGPSSPLVTSPDKVHECAPDSPLLSASDAAGRTLSNSHENKSVSAPSITPANKVSELECVTTDSPFPFTTDVADRALGTNEALSDSFSSKNDVSSSFQSSELFLPYFTDDEGRHVMPSTCSASLESSDILESRLEEFLRMAESICDSHAESDSCTYNVSTLSEAVTYEAKTVADLLPAHSISNPEGNMYEFGDDAHDPNMETIDLSSGVKHDEESVVLNGTFIRSASHGRRNFRYYKKLIKDAFTSRKRLSKEYEHLAILYGDIDIESSQHFRPSSVPSSPNSFILDMGLHSSQEMCDADWELL